MAHFAELDVSNVVLRVIVISNSDVNQHGGDESVGAEEFVEALTSFGEGGVAWKQTSYNSNFRKQYAAVGFSYDSGLDMFILPKPYPSYSLDSNGSWLAPVTYPNVTEIADLTVEPQWDEPNLRWVGSTFSDNFPYSGTEVKYRWDASALEWVAL